ncbi:H2 finger protein [Seminavis robusta]|uniref:H2 finger protein n=1 Tax=Seminavis robusta TaxID=568900 RepID=A0A9N8HQB5_9STRA|nr:H2 finger protein [Seminavis robusta]|eukprot:Sro1178_g249480.1 H2 finger protein (260) ;mRNA; r:10883-11662
MSGNKAVRLDGSQPMQGTNLALQAFILVVSIILAMACGWCLRSCLPRGSSSLLREALQRATETEERRKRFVDEHLESFEWRGEEEAAIKMATKQQEQNQKKMDKKATTQHDKETNLDVSLGCDGVEEEEERQQDHSQSHSHSDSTCSSANPDDQDCPVCLAPLQKGDDVAASDNDKCPHIFHRECVYMWLLRKTDCPMCRHTFLKGPEEEEEDVEQQQSTSNNTEQNSSQQNQQTTVPPPDSLSNRNAVVHESSEEVLA